MIIYALNETITRCPPNFPPEYMSYPSSAILYGVLSIATFAFALFIIIKYNSVKVWDKSFSPLYISNTLWIIYYLALFTRASCNTVRYALRPDANIEVTNILSLSNLILQGISAFALSLTINHQRKYRSTAPIHPNPNASAASIAGAGEKAPLVNTHGSMRAETGWLKAVSFIEILFSIFFLIYLVFLYLVLIKGHDEVFESLFLGAFVLQRLPIVVMTIAIVAQQSAEGPTRKSRIVFLVGSLLHLVNDLPTFMWAQILPHTCIIFNSMNWLDALNLFSFISIVLFFFFIRWEFLRNMEEVIWDKVNQIQTTFDFRRF